MPRSSKTPRAKHPETVKCRGCDNRFVKVSRPSWFPGFCSAACWQLNVDRIAPKPKGRK